MGFAFIIWSLISVLFLIIGIFSRKMKKPCGFFSCTEPPKVSKVRDYNCAVSKIWMVSAAIFELTGIPFLFLKQSSAFFILLVLLVVAEMLGMMIAYFMVESKYSK